MEKRYRKYTTVFCKFCHKPMNIRNDYLAHHLGACDSCRMKKNTHAKKHGDKNTRLYKIWAGIVSRCYNPHSTVYKTYGARGITMCNEWRNNYVMFKNWALAHGYTDTLTIDRIDVNKGYQPNNCRWITREENARRAHLIILPIPREKIRAYRLSLGKTQKEMANFLKVSRTTIQRAEKGAKNG